MNRLFIDAETLMISLLTKDKRDYLDIDHINSLCDFIQEQLIKEGYLDRYDSVILDADFDAIVRAVNHRNEVFELVGKRIYLKCDIKKLPNIHINKDLDTIITKFKQKA